MDGHKVVRGTRDRNEYVHLYGKITHHNNKHTITSTMTYTYTHGNLTTEFNNIQRTLNVSLPQAVLKSEKATIWYIPPPQIIKKNKYKYSSTYKGNSFHENCS
jgi:hypothetical protein